VCCGCALQIVQNGLTWGQLERQPFDKPGNPKVPNNGDFGIRNMEIRGLWAIMAVESVLLLAFISLAIGLMWVPYIGACKQHRVGCVGVVGACPNGSSAAASLGRFGGLYGQQHQTHSSWGLRCSSRTTASGSCDAAFHVVWKPLCCSSSLFLTAASSVSRVVWGT